MVTLSMTPRSFGRSRFPLIAYILTLSIACRESSSPSANATDRRPAPATTPAARDVGKPAIDTTRASCDSGDQSACVLYARSLLFGDDGLSRDPERSRDLAIAACSQSVPSGCTLAGLAFSNAFGDALAARDWLQRGCDLGDGTGCAALAYQHFEGGLAGEAKGVPVDPKRGIELATKACEIGTQHGCALLAKALANGEGVTQDVNRARELAASACDRDDPTGCVVAAKIAQHERREEDVQRFRARACHLGHSFSCR